MLRDHTINALLNLFSHFPFHRSFTSFVFSTLGYVDTARQKVKPGWPTKTFSRVLLISPVKRSFARNSKMEEQDTVSKGGRSLDPEREKDTAMSI